MAVLAVKWFFRQYRLPGFTDSGPCLGLAYRELCIRLSLATLHNFHD